VSVVWVGLAARARGLGTRLLSGAELESLAVAPDLRAVAQRLEHRLGRALAPTGDDPRVLERACRRRAGALVALLGRWAGERRQRACLDAVFAEEDRRSLRGIFRGMAAGDPPEARTAGALPTPALPEAALVELARQSRPGAVRALLALWGHPFGRATAGAGWGLGQEALRAGEDAEGEVPGPDPLALFRLELRLARAWAAAASAGARTGGAELRRWVAHRTDLENTATALIVSSRSLVETRIDDLFLAGGRHLGEALFATACRTGSPEATRALLAGALASTPCGVALSRMASTPGVGPEPTTRGPVYFEDLASRAEVEELRRRALLEPLSAAPVLLFVARLREELRGLRRVVWGSALAQRPAGPTAAGAVP